MPCASDCEILLSDGEAEMIPIVCAQSAADDEITPARRATAVMKVFSVTSPERLSSASVILISNLR